LEAKRIKAIANISPIADADETNDDEDFLVIPRTRDPFQNKIRLWINYSIRMLID
jgi:hypothetical protein